MRITIWKWFEYKRLHLNWVLEQIIFLFNMIKIVTLAKISTFYINYQL